MTTNFRTVMPPVIFHKFDINKSQNSLLYRFLSCHVSCFFWKQFLWQMQSVNPPGNKACQTGVENGHLRGNYPPFSVLHAIISRMFWSGPLWRTSLGCSRTICIAAKQTARTLGSGTHWPRSSCPPPLMATWSLDFAWHLPCF